VGGPDHSQAVEKYRREVPGYDRIARASAPLRRRAVESMALRSGDTVVDVGCGTGLTFDLLERQIGPKGRLIGIDLSPDMLARARERADAHGWDNVTLIEASVEKAEIPGDVDAAVFVLTHDIMRAPAALANAVSSLRPGGRVVSAGMKRGPRWAAPLSVLAIAAARRRYVTTDEGWDEPWSHLGSLVDELRVESLLLGFAYVATGRVPV
jgi:ubiquinone/menaquinone biosynthesis C-methylase UbiE